MSKIGPGKIRTDGRMHASTHAGTYIYRTSKSGDLVELNASGLDKINHKTNGSKLEYLN